MYKLYKMYFFQITQKYTKDMYDNIVEIHQINIHLFLKYIF